MKTDRIHPLLAIIFILMLTVAPFILCVGALVLPEIIFKFKLDIYPGTVRVGEAYGYYGADTGERVVYYWTSDPIEMVKNHFTSIAPPFVIHPRFQHLVTTYDVYAPNTTPIPIESISCTYQQRLSCVNIELIPIDSSFAELPEFLSRPAANVTEVSPLASPLPAGTLIVYSYFTNDF